MVLNQRQQERLTLAVQSGILLAALVWTVRESAKTPDLKKMKKAAAYAKKIKKLNRETEKMARLQKKTERTGA